MPVLPPRPALRIRSLADAQMALRAAGGNPLTLVSIPGAAGSAGAGWWVALVAELRTAEPDAAFIAILDCADAPGHALAALRAGATDIALEAPRGVLEAVEAIAAASGARLHAPPAPVFDLRGRRPAAAVRDVLAASA